MRFPAVHLTEPVSVRSYLGETSGAGPAHSAPVVTRCQLEAVRRLVRNDNGDEVVSSTTLRLSPDLDPTLDLEVVFAPESLVTVRGREAQVISAGPVLDRGLLVYVEVALS